MSDVDRDAVRLLVCPTCQQQLGNYCVTKTGKRAHEVHVHRWYPLTEAYGNGYADGVRDTEARQPIEVFATSNEAGDRVAWCSCGARCRDDDGGHPGHVIDVMHEHDMVVARLA